MLHKTGHKNRQIAQSLSSVQRFNLVSKARVLSKSMRAMSQMMMRRTLGK